MKKVLIFWLLLLALVWLASCSSPDPVVKKSGNKRIGISQAFINDIKGNDVNRPIFYSSNLDWLTNKRLDDQVWQIGDYTGDYVEAIDMEDSTFWLFQADIDAQKNVKKVLWSAKITDTPALELQSEDLPSKDNQTIAGLAPGKKVTRYIISAVPVDSNFDEFTDIENRYALLTRFKLSWDKDAFDNVDEIRQFDLSNQDGLKETSILLISGEHTATIDSRRGLYLQLLAQGSPAIEINDYKREDLETKGNLSLVKFNGQFYLKLDPTPQVKPPGINETPANSQTSSGYLSRLKPMRYAKLSNYAKTGFIRLPTIELLKDGQLANKNYEAALNWYINDGSLGLNPATGKPMGSFVTSPGKLKELSPDLYEKYKSSLEFPKSTESSKQQPSCGHPGCLRQPKGQPSCGYLEEGSIFRVVP